jgi:hypothetical protein
MDNTAQWRHIRRDIGQQMRNLLIVADVCLRDHQLRAFGFQSFDDAQGFI